MKSVGLNINNYVLIKGNAIVSDNKPGQFFGLFGEFLQSDKYLISQLIV